MNEQIFWKIIEGSKEVNSSTNARFRYIENELEVLSVQDVFKFDKVLWWLLKKADFEDLWAACCVLSNEYTAENFLYFRYWLIFQGQRIFKKALNDPEYLEIFVSDFKNDNIMLVQYADFEYLVERVYLQKTKLKDYKTANPFISRDRKIDIKSSSKSSSDTETLADLVPILCKKMGWDTEYYGGKWMSDN